MTQSQNLLFALNEVFVQSLGTSCELCFPPDLNSDHIAEPPVYEVHVLLGACGY